jgi:hypothetical protein
MFATYHPPNIPGDLAGKSSNSQWAFREVQRWYGGYVSRQPNAADWDMTKSFLTVGSDSRKILLVLIPQIAGFVLYQYTTLFYKLQFDELNDDIHTSTRLIMFPKQNPGRRRRLAIA